MCVRVCIFSMMKQVQSISRNRMADDTLNDSLRVTTNNTSIKKVTSAREALTTGISLIKICSKLLFVVI